MTTSVRAAMVRNFSDGFESTSVEIDRPRGREVLVETKASGLCHSDLHFVHEDRGLPLPIVLGHELAGIVVEVGPEVNEVAVGDHVVGCSVPSCGACVECYSGYRVNCLNQGVAARRPDEPPRISRNGEPVTQFVGLSGFADHALVHESQVVAVSKDVPFDRAALLGCGVVTGAGAVLRSAAVKPMETVVVLGAGGVGLNAVQASALVGARKVIVVDLNPAKLQLATKFGATHLVDPADGDPVEQVNALTGGLGADHVFEFTGAKQPLVQATAMVGRRGTTYVVGLQQLGETLDFAVAPGIGGTVNFEKGVRGVRMGSVNVKVDIPYYAELYAQGRFNLDDLVSNTIALDDITAGYEAVKIGAVARNVITF